MSFEIDDQKHGAEKADAITAHHEEDSLSPIVAEGKAVNPFLIFACVTFAAASFLFGYDDKVISPIMALHPFVSLSGSPTLDTHLLPKVHDVTYLHIYVCVNNM